MVQGDSMQNSFDSSEHHLQMPPSYQQLQQQPQEAIISDQASSQNIFGQGGGPPTSFSRDMFPQPDNDPGTVRTQIGKLCMFNLLKLTNLYFTQLSNFSRNSCLQIGWKNSWT